MRKKESSKIMGFSRVQIVDSDGSIASDSGYSGPNQIVNDGFTWICRGIASSANIFVASVGIGTGTAPNATHQTIQGHLCHSTATASQLYSNVSASISASKTLRFYGTIGTLPIGAGSNIQNIGLHQAGYTGTDFGTVENLFFGNTYSSSALASNQSVYWTYDIQFS